ncbi:MAG: 3-keto-5-aminohexanoate cleavage protein [Pusillimonas sp.]
MKKKTWIEAAVNGAWTRSKQPNIPISPDEIISDAIACGNAGASIVHYHAYDPETGQQTSSTDVNAYIVEGIKSKINIIVYPAVSPITAAQAISPEAGELRYATSKELGEKGFMEWMVVDPGSVNMYSIMKAEGAAGPQGYVYINTEATLSVGLELAKHYGIRPSYAIYEPGFIRWGSLLAKRYGVKTPIYRFMFSDQFSFGMPVEDFALEAYVRMLKREMPEAEWMVSGLGVDITPLIDATVSMGGHIRVGLEDAHLGSTEPSWKSVARAANAVVKSGGTVATALDVRNFLSNK